MAGGCRSFNPGEVWNMCKRGGEKKGEKTREKQERWRRFLQKKITAAILESWK